MGSCKSNGTWTQILILRRKISYSWVISTPTSYIRFHLKFILHTTYLLGNFYILRISGLHNSLFSVFRSITLISFNIFILVSLPNISNSSGKAMKYFALLSCIELQDYRMKSGKEEQLLSRVLLDIMGYSLPTQSLEIWLLSSTGQNKSGKGAKLEA